MKRTLYNLLFVLIVLCVQSGCSRSIHSDAKKIYDKTQGAYAALSSFQCRADVIETSTFLTNAPTPRVTPNSATCDIRFRRPDCIRIIWNRTVSDTPVQTNLIAECKGKSFVAAYGQPVSEVCSFGTARIFGSIGASYVYNYIPELLQKEEPFKFSTLKKGDDVVINGTPCYTLKGTRAGAIDYVYSLAIAKDTFLIHQASWSVIMGQKQRLALSQEMAKRKLAMPERMMPSNIPDIQMNWVITYSAITVNPTLDDSVFAVGTNAIPLRSCSPVTDRVHGQQQSTTASTRSMYRPTAASEGISIKGVYQKRPNVDYNKSPTFLDCFPNKVVIYTDRTTGSVLREPGDAVEKLLDEIEKNTRDDYLVVLVRPGSVKPYRQIRNLVSRRQIDVSYDPVDADFVVNWNNNAGTTLTVEINAFPSTVSSRPTTKQPADYVRQAATPVPSKASSNKSPVFFECRNHQVFYIDKSNLDAQVEKMLSTLTPDKDLNGFLKAVQSQQVGNEYYTVNPNYLSTAIVALDARPGVMGEPAASVTNPTGKYQKVLRQLNGDAQYLAFIVRDDSFQEFRIARKLADKYGLEVRWELLGEGEPIKFGAGGSTINVQ